MEITYQLTEEDLAAFRDHLKRGAPPRPWWVVRRVLAGVVVGLCTIAALNFLSDYSIVGTSPYRYLAFQLLILITGGAYLIAMLRALRAPRTYWQRHVAAPLHITITPLGWAVAQDSHTVEHAWEQLHAFSETEQQYFLFISPRQGYVIPKRAFANADHARAFTTALREYWSRNPENARRALLDRPSVEEWMRRRRVDFVANLRAGMRLARLLPVSAADFKANAAQLVRMIALPFAAGVSLQYLAALPDPQFNFFNTPTFGVDVLLFLASGLAVARVMGNTRSAAKFLVMVSSASALLAVPIALAFAVGKIWPSVVSAWLAWFAGMFYLAWLVVIAFRAVTILYRPTLPLAVFATGLYAALNFFVMLALPDGRLFYSTDEKRDDVDVSRLNVEDTYYAQSDLMRAATDALAAERPGVSDLFFLGFAGEAEERVFANEVNYVRNLFDERFDTAGRSLVLVNNNDTVSDVPLASVHNLRFALRAIAARMDKANDALFLFLTSHGSRRHELSVQFWPLELNLLPADELKSLLDESGIRNRIIVVSACYSGGFIDALKDENSLIITAAARDKTSFGCGVRSKFTYFGEAYFKEALKSKTSFVEAFEVAKASIEQREQRERIDASNPQIFVGANIHEVLDRLAR